MFQLFVDIFLEVELDELTQVRALVTRWVQLIPCLITEALNLDITCRRKVSLLEKNALTVLQEILQLLILRPLIAVIFDHLKEGADPGFHRYFNSLFKESVVRPLLLRSLVFG